MRLLSVDRLNALYDRHAHLRGADFARSVLEDLGIDYEVFVESEEVEAQLHTLDETPFITISNHPYGSIDGVILADLFGHRCANYKIMVNRILSRVESLAPSFISVTPTGVERTAATKESIMGVRRALGQLRSGGGLGLFPSGAVSDLSLREGCVRDRPWQPAIISLIAKARVPIMPVRFFDRNSSFYYALGLIDWRVRLLRLPAEVFNKAGRPVRIGLAPLISIEEQQDYLATHTIEEFGSWLRSKVYGMEIRS
jgi:putative hemolysin